MRSALALIICVSLLLVTGCAGNLRVSDNSLRLTGTERVVLQEIRFDYGQWTNQKTSLMANARKSEAEWGARIRAGYENASRELGIDTRSGPAVPLTIEVTDLDPGSVVKRLVFQSSSGRATVLIDASCEGRGSLQAGGSLEEHQVFATFNGVLEDLGAAIARAVASRRRG